AQDRDAVAAADVRVGVVHLAAAPSRGRGAVGDRQRSDARSARSHGDLIAAPVACGTPPVAMKIHEYQGKQLFRKYGVPVPIGIPAMSVEEAIAAIPQVQQQAGSDVVVVKAQIHAGGRGKGGGVKVARTRADAEAAVKKIFGMQLVTPQTGPEGKKVQRLLIEQGLAIEHEYYLGMLLDRTTARVTVMASTEGGMDIEEVAAKHPEKILKEAIAPATGWQDWQSRRLAKRLGLGGAVADAFAGFMRPLAR